MKYYRYDMWQGINSEDPKVCEDAKQEFEKNGKEYAEIFQLVKQRLPKQFLKPYLGNSGFHDWFLASVQVLHEKRYTKKPITISLEVTNGKITYRIIYDNVKKIAIDYAKETDDRMGFDDWGYDEFLPVDDEFLSHEILFWSGAIILVHFENIGIEKVK